MVNPYFKIQSYIDKYLCLEIAPLNRPHLPKEHPNTRYLDLLSTKDLKKHFKDDVNVDNAEIVEVHYIHKGKPYKKLVKGKKFGLIIASHVLEHVPNLITWLNDIESILHDDGIVQFAIPDKRYCFDFRRRLTDLPDIIGAYLEDRKRPVPGIVYEHFLYVPNEICNDPFRHHAGEVSQEFTIKKEYHEIAMKFAKDSLKGYVDTHCWVFTPESFIKLMGILYDNDLIKLKVIAEETKLTEVNSYEFYITMRK